MCARPCVAGCCLGYVAYDAACCLLVQLTAVALSGIGIVVITGWIRFGVYSDVLSASLNWLLLVLGTNIHVENIAL
jgi:hypothetical protein